MSAGTAQRVRVVAVAALALILVAVAWTWARLEASPGSSKPVVQGATENPTDHGCGPTLREPVGGAGDHVDEAPITYAGAPPSFGDHSSRWEVRAETFYFVQDRPAVPVLVHNLEHGYNILWYDDTVVEDAAALARVRAIAEGYASLDRSPDPATAFIAAPWSAEDGDAFPEGMHYALTHWYADPMDRTRSRTDEMGLTRYCAKVSASLVRDWMTAYPLSDAPEGYPDLM